MGIAAKAGGSGQRRRTALGTAFALPAEAGGGAGRFHREGRGRAVRPGEGGRLVERALVAPFKAATLAILESTESFRKWEIQMSVFRGGFQNAQRFDDSLIRKSGFVPFYCQRATRRGATGEPHRGTLRADRPGRRRRGHGRNREVRHPDPQAVGDQRGLRPELGGREATAHRGRRRHPARPAPSG